MLGVSISSSVLENKMRSYSYRRFLYIFIGFRSAV